MAEGFIVRRGGPGGGLNLNVKLGEIDARPSVGKQNDLWVETSIKMSEYVLSAEKPDIHPNGTLWIQMVSTGRLLDLLKKNKLLTGLKTVMIYSGGKWEPLNAWIFDDGKWVQTSYEWRGELYSPGNQWEGITGGWSDGVTVTGGNWRNGSIDLSGSVMSMSSDAKPRASFLCTNNPVSLEGYNNIEFKIDKITGSFYSKRVVVASTRDQNFAPGSAGKNPIDGEIAHADIVSIENPVNLPITEKMLSAPVYVGIVLAGQTAYSMDISSIKLTKGA